MYKDVCKRILAVAVVICMVVTLVEWPAFVKAEEAPSYHIYQYAGTESADFETAKKASAVFMTGQNAAGGAEIFAGASFDVHVDESAEFADTKAVLELYTSPTPGNPESGYFVASSEIYGLTEGTNNISFDAASPKLMPGECFSVILTLEGEGLSFYTDVYEGMQHTFAKQDDGTWKDMGASSRAIALRAVTYDEKMVEPQNASFMEKIATALSAEQPLQPGDAAEMGNTGAAGEEGTPDKGTDMESSGAADGTETPGNGADLGNAEAPGNGTGEEGSETAGKPGDAGISNEGTGTDGLGGLDGTGAPGAGVDSESTETPADSEMPGEPNDGENKNESGAGSAPGMTEPGTADTTENTEASDKTSGVPNEVQKDSNGTADEVDASVPFVNATVELSVVSTTLGVGEEINLSVNVKTGTLKNPKYAWNVDNGTYATVVPNGDGAFATVRGVAVGETTVTVAVTDDNGVNQTLSCKVVVKENVKSFTVEPEVLPNCTYNGVAQIPEITVKNGETVLTPDTDYSVTVTNNVNVSTDGTLAEVIITGKNDYAGQVTKTFKIEPKMLTETDVTVKEMNPDEVTDEAAVAARIIVTGVNQTQLVRDTDYTLTYEDATPAAPGRHTAVIKGIGNYTGEVRKEYLVKSNASKLRIEFVDADAVGTGAGYIYTAREIHPQIVVYQEDGEVLGTENYTVEYSNCLNVGTATVTVNVQAANYAGAAVADFTIVQKDIANTDNTRVPVEIPETLPIAARTQTGDPVPAFEMTQNGIGLLKDTDYTLSVRYADGENGQTANAATLIITGKGNYQGTVEKPFKIGMDIQEAIASVSVDNAVDAIYTGEAICPTVTVTPKTGTLQAGVDYEVTYSNNVNAGTAKVYVRGIGNYGGVWKMAPDKEYSAEFTIKPFDVKGLTYTYNNRVPYSPNTEKMKPSVTVAFQGIKLEKGTDYTLAYPADETELAVGKTPKITVSGTGNFTGTHDLAYEITPCPLDNPGSAERPIVLSMVRTHQYTGNPVDPQIALNYVDEDGKSYALIKDRDYVVENYENVKVGTHTVTIKGLGNYAGTRIDKIVITGLHIKNAVIEIIDGIEAEAQQDYHGSYLAFRKYTGTAIEPKVKLTYNGKELIQNTDYRVEYVNNRTMSTAKATAKIHITAEGNYVGEMEIPFLIYKRLDDCSVSGVRNQTYTGEPVTFPNLTVRDGLLDGTLVPDVDYQVEYTDNLNVTTNAKVTIKAIDSLPTQNGCYFGEKSETFGIAQLDLGNINNLVYQEIVKTYAGQPVTLTGDDIKLSYPLPSGIGKKELQEGTDFEIDAGSYSYHDRVTADNPAEVVIKGKNNFTGAKKILFTIVGKSISSVDAKTIPAQKYTGTAIEPKPEVTDNGQPLKEGIDYKLSYKNNVDAGDATVILTGTGSYSGTKELPFKILPLNIADTNDGDATVTGIADSYSFTGAEIVPEPVVKFTRKGTADAKTLLSGKDYTVSCERNRDIGTATVKIIGTGNYTGVVGDSFIINAKSITDSDVKVAKIPAQAWTGMQICPPVTITCGDYTLREKEDYTLSYSNNLSYGTATVTITGTGNYTGTRTTTFSIAQSIESKDIVVTCDAAGKSFTYTGNEIKPSVEVQDLVTGQKLVEGTNYEVVYENNIEVGTAGIIVRGIGSYTGEKAPIQFKIVAKDIGDADVVATLAGQNYAYTGEAIEPKATVKYNNKTLNAGTDYVIRYSNNINAGTATAVIMANGGNYIGIKTLTYVIAPKSIGSGNAFATGFMMDKIEAQGYTGEPICPTPSIYYRNADGSKTKLVYGDSADYTLAYENNTAIGNAGIIISGTGNYTGTVKQNFEIRGGLTGAVITLAGVSDGTIRYEDGTKQGDGSYLVEPEPTVVLNGITLKKGTDYTVTYEKNDFVGEAKAVIAGAGNYGGTISQSFTILGDIKKAEVAPIGRQVYTGQVIEPIPVVTYYGRMLKDGTDYIRSYADNIEIGTASLTIAGNAYFTGIQTVTFNIDPADGKFVVAEIPAQKYCGRQIIPEVSVSFAGRVLTKDADYIVRAGANKDAGEGSIEIIGKGSYENVQPVIKKFTINPLDVNELKLYDPENTDDTFVGIAPKEYTGSVVTPKITLSYEEGGTEIYKLTANDYAMRPAEGYTNTDVGEAAVVIAGKGKNVYGERTEYFTITQKDINNKPVTISVSGSSSYIYTGAQICPNVVVKNGMQVLAKDVDYFVDYGENINAGNGTVTIQGNGNYMGSKTVTFTIGKLGMNAASIKVQPIPEQNYTGSAVCPPITVMHTDSNGTEHLLVENTDYKLTYQSNIAAGTKARAVIAGMGNFSGSRTVTFTIVGHDIAAEDVLLESIPNQAYTGKALTPSVTLTYGGQKLVRGTDYNLSYANNIELGTATVTIDGKGNFAGSRTTQFEIVASDISTAEVTIQGENKWVYTGEEIKPAEVIVKIGETVLAANTDYTLSYKNNIDAGSALLIVNGAGEYGGSKEVPFQIERKDITAQGVGMTGFEESMTYTGEAVEQNIVLTYGAKTLEKDKDYIVQYSGNTAIGTAKMLVTGTGNYTGEIEKTFEISEKQIFDENLIVKDLSSTYTYTGEAIMPKPVLFIGDTELVEGTDYTIVYENNIDAGVATMTITGTGNYAGNRQETFDILRKSINLGTFSGIDTQIYSGKEIKPTVLVSDNGRALALGQDYSLMYENNRNAGRATAVVAGMKNYTAVKSLYFDIRPGSMSGLAVTGTTDASISLGWKAGGVVTGYEVYRAGADGKYQRIARIRGTNYTDKQLTAGESYTYKVRAYLVTENETYYSAFSPVVNGKL